MAKHIYYTCDRCGRKLPDDYSPLCVIVDRQADAAGGMENVVEKIDLCQNCLTAVVGWLLEGKSYEERQTFLEFVRGKKA